jgi:uncharacterized protein YuzE
VRLERLSLFLRLDDRKQQVINHRVDENVVLGLGDDQEIVGIEVLDASKHLSLEKLLPVEYEISRGAQQSARGVWLAWR